MYYRFERSCRSRRFRGFKEEQTKRPHTRSTHDGLTKRKSIAIYFSSCDSKFSIAKTNKFILHLFSQMTISYKKYLIPAMAVLFLHSSVCLSHSDGSGNRNLRGVELPSIAGHPKHNLRILAMARDANGEGSDLPVKRIRVSSSAITNAAENGSSDQPIESYSSKSAQGNSISQSKSRVDTYGSPTNSVTQASDANKNLKIAVAHKSQGTKRSGKPRGIKGGSDVKATWKSNAMGMSTVASMSNAMSVDNMMSMVSSDGKSDVSWKSNAMGKSMTASSDKSDPQTTWKSNAVGVSMSMSSASSSAQSDHHITWNSMATGKSLSQKASSTKKSKKSKTGTSEQVSESRSG